MKMLFFMDSSQLYVKTCIGGTNDPDGISKHNNLMDKVSFKSKNTKNKITFLLRKARELLKLLPNQVKAKQQKVLATKPTCKKRFTLKKTLYLDICILTARERLFIFKRNAAISSLLCKHAFIS